MHATKNRRKHWYTDGDCLSVLATDGFSNVYTGQALDLSRLCVKRDKATDSGSWAREIRERVFSLVGPREEWILIVVPSVL